MNGKFYHPSEIPDDIENGSRYCWNSPVSVFQCELFVVLCGYVGSQHILMHDIVVERHLPHIAKLEKYTIIIALECDCDVSIWYPISMQIYSVSKNILIVCRCNYLWLCSGVEDTGTYFYAWSHIVG